MKLAIKSLLFASPALFGAAFLCDQIGLQIVRQSPPDSFDGFEWYLWADYLMVAGILSPFVALCLWIVHRGL